MRAWGKALGAVAAAMLWVTGAMAAPDQVHLAQGDIKGAVAGKVASFKGIPFAAPPVGDLRWRAPQPAAAWSGVRDGTGYGAACLQKNRTGVTGAEDCLYLNIWTPAERRAGAKLPVMVWIYGGAFVLGTASSPFYDGTHFAERGVVMVNFNYRLGRFGFFAHPALSHETPAGPLGNYGLMDQIAALKWVKANIAAFGGDPNQVTIFGESAGGISVNYLMGSPAARGLFSKAISESGFGRLTALPIHDASGRSAEAGGAAFAEAQGIRGDDAAAATALRALPVETLMAGIGGLGDPNLPQPMVDGVIVTETLPQTFSAGHQAKVPYLEGGNSWEASLFPAIRMNPDVALSQAGGDRDKVVALYGGGSDMARIATDLTTDSMITEPDRFLARQVTKAGAPAYVYHFSYVPQVVRASLPGAGHGSEIAYVFDNLASEPRTVGGRTFPAATPEDRKIGDAMIAYWVAFAKTGDPGGAGGVHWPRYTLAGDELLEISADGLNVRHAFEKDRLDWLAAKADAGK